MLDNRLKKIAELVSGNGIAVDVGTDHAYLAAELINSGKCSRVIASDVKEGPLDSARNTVDKYGIQDKVELVLSDGLENVSLDGVSDVVIAGMGGETIADIIGAVEIDSIDKKNIRWVLQPMTKPEILRRKLYEHNLEITGEYVAEEGDKLYVIMTAEYCPFPRRLTEAESVCGFFDDEDKTANKYRAREAERLEKVADSLEKAGRNSDAQHYRALAQKVINGIGVENTCDVIEHLNELYPFAAQEKWDNSGYLVESSEQECSRILLSLDITSEAVDEADLKCAELIISHHPVIFEPRKRIKCSDPVYKLIASGIGAVCMHTNLDIAEGGTNGVILSKLSSKFRLCGEPEPFEELGGGNNLGWIVTLNEAVNARKLAEVCKEIFDCEFVRTSRSSNKLVSKIAFCSGSGGSMLGLAGEKGCDALITGDVKHDVWVDANNYDIALLDCGHFHTENIVLEELRRVLEEKFPLLDIEIAESSVDPCDYV